MTSEGFLPFVNPATGEQFGRVRVTTTEEVTRALQEMRQNAAIWSRRTARERAHILRQLQEVLVEHADEITAVVNQDTGKSRQDAFTELFMVVDKLQTYVKHAPHWLARQSVPRGIYVFKRYYAEPHPYGVVAVIGPWNFPLDLSIPPVYAALLAGNTVVLKPSEVTPAVGVLIEKLFRSVPELSPFVRVIHGGPETGAALVAAQPDLVFLTGSTKTGRKVAQATAATMTPFISELGGKDAMIVLEDADIEAAARWGVWGAFFNCGQTCVAVERVYVVEQVYDAFVAAVLQETKRMRQGYSPDKLNPNVLGPLTFERQLHIIEDHMQDALEKGAYVLTGGKREGLFVEPTVMVGVNHTMKLMQDETFGPIMPIMKVKDEQEAVRLTNESYYGLSASVWSQDQKRAERLAHELEVGSVVVNDTIAHYAVSQLPFGGLKHSGTARTHGKQEVLQFTQTRSYGVGGVPFFLDVAARLREPQNYSLMSAIFHLLFGVTPRQRLRAVTATAEYIGERWQKAVPGDKKDTAGKAATVAAAVAAAVTALAALRRRETR
jgi:acyl-CoA reductase-like NAD-dependent aldehyde dehydrogenase